MAGTINIALTQQFDSQGIPLIGGLLYFFAASTTTPQNAFQDIALTIPWSNPIVLDASGRVPMFYLADGNIKIRLTNKSGVTVLAADNLLVVGPSTSGGGGGGGVDATTVMATGDMKARFGVGPLNGFVRCNGLTMGNAVSGATERANADCQALFEYLWATNVLGVFSGTTPNRGPTPTGDFNANKIIVLPDLRGRAIIGMDDMGSSAAGRVTGTYWGNSGLTLGNAGGAEAHGLAAANMVDHFHNVAGATFGENAQHSHTFSAQTGGQSNVHTHNFLAVLGGANIGVAGPNTVGNSSAQVGTTDAANQDHSHFVSGTTDAESPAHAHGFNVNSSGMAGASSSPLATAMGSMVMTYYMKL